MKRLTWLSVLLAFALGFAVGRRGGVGSALRPPAAPPRATARASSAAALAATGEATPAADEPGATRPAHVLSGRDRRAVFVDLARRNGRWGLMSAFWGDGKLNPVFADLFELDATAQTALTDAVAKARAEITRLQVANASVTRPDANTVVIRIAPTAEGEGVEAELRATLARVLGPERQQAFDVLASSNLRDVMQNYGVQERVITITRNAHPGDANAQFVLKDVQDIVTPNDAESGVMSTTFGSTDELRQTLGEFANLVPKEFQGNDGPPPWLAALKATEASRAATH